MAIEKLNVNSYEGIRALIMANGGCINAYENEEGELVTLIRGITDDGIEYVTKKTLQNNNHTRINCYYEDGTTTETFM